MTVSKIIGAISAACAAVTLLAAPAAARPHHRPHAKRVCHWEWHHHHRVRICRTQHWR